MKLIEFNGKKYLINEMTHFNEKSTKRPNG